MNNFNMFTKSSFSKSIFALNFRYGSLMRDETRVSQKLMTNIEY